MSSFRAHCVASFLAICSRLQSVILAFAVLSLLLHGAGPLAADADDPGPQEIPLAVSGKPINAWSKQQLAADIGDDGSLTISDKTGGSFNDASFWDIPFNTDLPYGEKHLSFDVEIDPEHRPLWGPKLVRVVIDGEEAEVAPDANGRPSFVKNVHNGQGYVPAQAATIRLVLPREMTRLSMVGLKTAGAEKMHFVLRNFRVTAWPQVDDRVHPQRPVLSELGHRPQDGKLLLIEWHDDPESRDTEHVVIDLSGPSGQEGLSVTLPQQASVGSGSRVSRVDLGPLPVPGTYVVTVPATGPRTVPASVTLEVMDDTGLGRHRDDAWGVFYWVTNDDTGPHAGAHRQDRKARVFGDDERTRDVSGGWFDAGDYGKYTVNGAYAVSLMLLTGLVDPQALDHRIDPLAGGRADWPDWLDVAATQLAWLVRMQDDSGGANHKAATRDWPGLDVSPQQDEAVKWIMPVTSTATANTAATLSLAARVFRDQPGSEAAARAQTYRAAADRARQWLNRNPGFRMIEKRYDGKAYGGAYFDTDDADERFFADAAWAALTRDPKDLEMAQRQLPAAQARLQASGNGLYWGKVDLLAVWALKSIDADLSGQSRALVDTVLRDAAQAWLRQAQASPWAIPHDDAQPFVWGSNSVLATAGWHWMLWAHASGERQYADAAHELVHWFFGRNPQGQTYITGTSDRAARDPHFRPFVSGAIDLPDGMLVGGPNSGGLAGDPAAARLASLPPMHIYVDDRKSYATNEVAINWQAVWALYTSLLSAP